MACNSDITAARNYILDRLQRDDICSKGVLDSVRISLQQVPPPSAGARFTEAWEDFVRSERTKETIFPALETARKNSSRVPGVQLLVARYVKEIIRSLADTLWGERGRPIRGELSLRVAATNGGYQRHNCSVGVETPALEFNHAGVRTCIIDLRLQPGESVSACEMFCLIAMAARSHKANSTARSHTVRVVAGSPFSQFRIMKATIPTSVVIELGKRSCNYSDGFGIELSPYFDALDQKELHSLVAAFFNE